MRLSLAGWLAVGLLAGLSQPSTAAITISGYDPNLHDRFTNHSTFIGSGYDWSGVGRTDEGRWGVLVSPSFALSAAHLAPSVDSTLRYYPGNDPSSAPVDRKVIANVSLTQLGLTASSDLVLSQLSSPATGIAHYPVLSLPSSRQLVGQQLFVWGASDSPDPPTSMRLGRNEVTAILPAFSDPVLGASTGDVFIYDFDTVNGLGIDEARAEGGDSGAPSFVVSSQGQLTLAGVHWFQYTAPDNLPGSMGSGDTLISSFISSINAAMQARGSSERLITITAIPEPSGLGLLVVALAATIGRRRTRRSSNT
ncbi:MAG: PEP-CTERM sorting domain-containing protein [Planctomycetales bacterium]|nr:PEP-CTERM sorting domain-containing protein [Planctomycetales bacterium]